MNIPEKNYEALITKQMQLEKSFEEMVNVINGMSFHIMELQKEIDGLKGKEENKTTYFG